MNKKNKEQIIKAIDAAIDDMDIHAIDRSLDALSAVEPQPIRAEDAKLFSARIQKMDKENRLMKKPRKTMRIAIVAAVVLLTGLTVYAASSLRHYVFQQGDQLITLRTTENITEQEAKELIGENDAASAPTGEDEAAHVIKSPPVIAFDSAERAAKEMDMEIILPSAMPDMALDSASGQRLHVEDGYEIRTVWLNYADEQGRLFGVTVTRSILPPEGGATSYTANDIDAGSLNAYKTPSGVEYTLLTESDEAGEMTAHIAMTMLGEYEYALVFFGFDEAERQAVIDSAELSALQ